ncbi:hypothetical protein [Pyxidicoccus parkwayensis]|uniref:hypothetical protein n=1 Tax=Pyxidicoccus parkwayensis TaxID=2813578 RepID=UPI001F50CA2A|nr:hypothetical protein [Pyxidicoccus parkwaysis]
MAPVSFAATSEDVNVGAWILGRNMFGPMRGPWPDDGWKGWWGSNLEEGFVDARYPL